MGVEEGNSAAANSGSGNGGGGGSSAAMSLQQQQQQQLLLQQQAHQLRLFQQFQQQQQQQQRPPQQSSSSTMNVRGGPAPPLSLQQQRQQQQQQQRQQQQQQQQEVMSRFPSNIDAHLRPPGLRNLHLQQQQQLQQQHHHQLQQAGRSGVGIGVRSSSVEVEMAQQDAARVCNPDFKRPFASLEDAVLRLLPYHVVADYEAEEDDRILDSDTTGQVTSRLQQWDQNILNKIAEFTGTFEKQVLAFNIMCRKKAMGEFRSEERLMLEQALLQDEKHAMLELRAEMESREKAGRDAAEAKMRMAIAQAELARAEAKAQAGLMSRPAPMRVNSLRTHADDGDAGQEPDEMMQGWNVDQKDEEDPSEDFLNDENEHDNGDGGMQENWREARALDLNSR